MPRAGWVLADDIELALVYFAGNHNLKTGLSEKIALTFAPSVFHSSRLCVK